MKPLPEGPWDWHEGVWEHGDGFDALVDGKGNTIMGLNGLISDDAVMDAIAAVPELIQTLKLWKCGACGGRGTYQQDKKGRERKEALGLEIDPSYQPDPVTCSRCNGDGLEPAAHEALVLAGIIDGTKP